MAENYCTTHAGHKNTKKMCLKVYILNIAHCTNITYIALTITWITKVSVTFILSKVKCLVWAKMLKYCAIDRQQQ